jgi:tetratricopeptide (TPR) repeat protein
MNNEAKPLAPRLEEAKKWFEKALESPSQDSSGDPYYYLALYYKALGDSAKQRLCLQDCISINPRNVEALREQRLLSMRARKKGESQFFKSIQKMISKYTAKKN